MDYNANVASPSNPISDRAPIIIYLIWSRMWNKERWAFWPEDSGAVIRPETGILSRTSTGLIGNNAKSRNANLFPETPHGTYLCAGPMTASNPGHTRLSVLTSLLLNFVFRRAKIDVSLIFSDEGMQRSLVCKRDKNRAVLHRDAGIKGKLCTQNLRRHHRFHILLVPSLCKN